MSNHIDDQFERVEMGIIPADTQSEQTQRSEELDIHLELAALQKLGECIIHDMRENGGAESEETRQAQRVLDGFLPESLRGRCCCADHRPGRSDL